ADDFSVVDVDVSSLGEGVEGRVERAAVGGLAHVDVERPVGEVQLTGRRGVPVDRRTGGSARARLEHGAERDRTGPDPGSSKQVAAREALPRHAADERGVVQEIGHFGGSPRVRCSSWKAQIWSAFSSGRTRLLYGERSA